MSNFPVFLLICLFINSLSALDFQERYIPHQDGKIYCRTVGQGHPIIVIHGSPSLTHDYLEPHFLRLADNNQVIFYDQRGCGKSESIISQDTISLESFVSDIEALRKSLGVEKVTLLGHSWGGFLALNYAIQYPNAVQKLILIDTMPASQEEFSESISEVMKRLSPIHDRLQEIEKTDLYLTGDPSTVEMQLKMVFQTYLYNQDDIAKLNFNVSNQAFVNGSKTFEFLCAAVYMKPYNIFPKLANLKIPTLILHGETDPFFYKAAEHIHQTLPHSKIVKIHESGHFPFVEAPAILFKEIDDFLGIHNYL